MSIAEKLTAIAENEQKVYDAGKKAGHDDFWDSYQQKGALTYYSGSFYGCGWNDSTFKPKYDIRPTSALNMFRENKITNLKEILRQCGVSLDLSNISAFGYAFYASTVTELPTLDVSKVTASAQSFYNCSRLTDVGFKMSEKTKLDNNTFQNCSALRNVIIEGIVANNLNFQWSTNLSRDSIESVINHLSGTASGCTLTLSEEAVRNAFGAVILSSRAVGTETINGLTIVTAEDGSVTINGTAAGDVQIRFDFSSVAEQGETWNIKLHDNLSGLVDQCGIIISNKSGSATPYLDGYNITSQMADGDTAYGFIDIYAGRKIDNLILTPQIKAFNPNSTMSEWGVLVNSKRNWRISLV